MPPNTDHQVICAYLNSLNIHYSDGWVAQCVNDCKLSNPAMQPHGLKSAVYEKWLSSNLRELEVPSLPTNLTSHHKITLNGVYAVQVESMINSAKSAYSELQRIQDIKTEEVNEKSEEEVNTKRCLTFVLCDGVQEVQAMEYQCIPNIKLNDPNFLPGFKMLVKGPVVCRKGMLLLTEKNVKILGGRVESLSHTNNLLSLLQKSLGLNTNVNENNSHQQTNTEDNSSTAVEVQNVQTNVKNSVQPGVSISQELVDIDELLSENDDILVNIPLEAPDLENENRTQYNRNARERDLDLENNSHRTIKKPKVNNNHEVLVEENFKNHSITSTSVSGIPEKSFRKEDMWCSMINKKDTTAEKNLTNFGTRYNGSCSGSSGRNQTSETWFSESPFGDDDIIIEDEFESMLIAQETESRSKHQTKVTGRCTQTQISSYLVNKTKHNAKSDLPGTSSGLFKTAKTVMSYPFVYLKQISEVSLSKPTTFTVKAIILTLKSKISIKDDAFSLRASISDGSSSVQVNFSSQVLENILEYSPCEITSMMAEKNSNSAICDRLKGIFFSAQQKLLSMNCLMEVRFFTDKSAIPLVVRLEEVQLCHLNALKGRC